MGLPWSRWLILVWCSGIYGYNLQRVEEDTVPSGTIEYKFFDDGDSSLDDDLITNLRNMETTKAPGTVGGNKMYLLFMPNNNYTGDSSGSTPLDSWSVVWYIASFGGLIVFFLIVSCSEWCCRRAIRNNQQNCSRNAPAATPSVPDTPPPSYEQFAPPSYESIYLGRNSSGEKSEYDIYVVPVHTLGTLVESRRSEDTPPSYLSASGLDNSVLRVT